MSNKFGCLCISYYFEIKGTNAVYRNLSWYKNKTPRRFKHRNEAWQVLVMQIYFIIFSASLLLNISVYFSPF